MAVDDHGSERYDYTRELFRLGCPDLVVIEWCKLQTEPVAYNEESREAAESNILDG